jgi:hypothetical protein
MIWFTLITCLTVNKEAKVRPVRLVRVHVVTRNARVRRCAWSVTLKAILDAWDVLRFCAVNRVSLWFE